MWAVALGKEISNNRLMICRCHQKTAYFNAINSDMPQILLARGSNSQVLNSLAVLAD